MTRGGARKGAGRRQRTPEEKRHPLNCLVSFQSLAWVQSERERTGYSAGELVDLAIEILQKHPEELPPDVETEDTEEE